MEERERDDPERLEKEAREQIQRHADEIRKAKVPIDTEPPTVYRP